MDLKRLTPAPDERMFICGRSGTGKTTLIKRLVEPLAAREPVIILDSKPDETAFAARHWWEPWKKKIPYTILGPRADIRHLRPGLYIYRPSYPAWGDPMVSRILLAAMKRKKQPAKGEAVITIVPDEFANFAKGPTPMPAMAKAIREGRSKHVRMIIGTQRPASVPLIAITEAVKYACFRLTSDDDRRRMATWVDSHMIEKPPGRHDFWFKDDGSDFDTVYLIHQGKSL